jgi:hypothetical protein
MKESRISAVRFILVCLALCCAPALFARSVHAATVFSSYNGVNCNCISALGFYASGFTPADDYDFTGAAAFVLNENVSSPQSFSMALYSSTATGAPGSSLWTSGTLSAPAGATLVSASYGGSPILLTSGHSYFLALDLSGDDSPGWLGGGSSSTPVYFSSDGVLWTNDGSASLQFEISGSPVASIPEPSTWALLLLGFGGSASRRVGERERNRPHSLRKLRLAFNSKAFRCTMKRRALVGFARLAFAANRRMLSKEGHHEAISN